MQLINNTIEQAIEQKKQLLLKISYGDSGELSDLFMHPYLVGVDVLEFEFVWGYLPDEETFYKVLALHIISAQNLGLPFEVRPDACYQYASGDEIPYVVEGFENMYAAAATNAKKN